MNYFKDNKTWRDFYDSHWSKFYSACADNDFDKQDPINQEESFEWWLIDEGLLEYKDSDYN